MSLPVLRLASASTDLFPRTREAAASVWACIHSWTYLHNESGVPLYPHPPLLFFFVFPPPHTAVNILSHVAGAVLFVLLTAALVLDTWPWTRAPPASSTAGPAPMRPADRRAAMAYLAGVAVCFVLSAAFHTLLCHRSPRVAARGMALDIAGILVLMAGATVPLIHFGLACAPPAARAALHVATALLGGACAAAAGGSAGSGPPRGTGGLLRRLLASVQGPAHGHRRAALFCGFAAVSFAAPLVWMSAVAADPDWRRRVSLWPGVLLTLAGNTVGAAAYTAKFPERWWPRRFDLLGASHQIMHMAVLAAAVAYAVGVDRALTFRRSAEGAVCRNGYGG